MATSRTGTALWKRLRVRLIAEREHVCHWCAKTLDAKAPSGSWNAIEIDHLVPVSLSPGLAHELSNLTLACHPCNRSKSNREAPNLTRRPRPSRSAVSCAHHDPVTATCPHSRAW
jgi:5-methylcytosine-specific restriction endonuclease McrA